VLRVHRVPGMDDDEVPTCPQVLRMATEHGAATTPFAEQIGKLEPGRAADLVLLRWRDIAYPYLDRDSTTVDAVVHRAKSGAVDTVIVAGEPILREGRFTRVDKAALLEELAASLRVPPTDEEERRRRLAKEVFPHVKRFYEGYLAGEVREPFYQPSSRR
jgi:cytosine/adenosine deaminase-related metal-dependent hydrolase